VCIFWGGSRGKNSHFPIQWTPTTGVYFELAPCQTRLNSLLIIISGLWFCHRFLFCLFFLSHSRSGLKITQLQLNCQMKNLDRGWCAQGINPRLVVRLKHLQYLYSLFSVYNNKNNCSKLIMRSLQFQIKSFLFSIYQIFEPSANFSAEFKSLLWATNHGIPCVSNKHFLSKI